MSSRIYLICTRWYVDNNIFCYDFDFSDKSLTRKKNQCISDGIYTPYYYDIDFVRSQIPTVLTLLRNKFGNGSAWTFRAISSESPKKEYNTAIVVSNMVFDPIQKYINSDQLLKDMNTLENNKGDDCSTISAHIFETPFGKKNITNISNDLNCNNNNMVVCQSNANQDRLRAYIFDTPIKN